jgi:DNA polymerase III epsilon subunit-like protein
MAEKDANYRLDYDTVVREGQDPRVFIPALAGTLRTALTNGLSLVGHNLCAYDLVLLSRAVTNLTGESLLIPTDRVFDTGMMVKAKQLNNVPNDGENQLQWFQRVYNTRSRVKWKLDGYCADTYDLWGKSGLDPTAAHDALSDCILTHHLFQSLKEIVEYGEA